MKQRRLPKPSLRPSAVVVGLLLVVALLGVLAWIRLVAPPSMADYRNAQAQAELHGQLLGQLDEASSEYAQAIVGSLRVALDGSKLKADAGDERVVFDVAVAELIDSADRLETSPATKDKQVKAAVSAVTKQAREVKTMVTAMTDEYDDYYRAYSACDGVKRFEATTDAAATLKRYDDVSKECLGRLDGLKKSKVDGLRAYAAELSAIIGSTRDTYEAMTKKTPGNHAATLAKLDGRFASLDPVTTVQRIRGDTFSAKQTDALVELLARRQKS